MGKLTIEIIKNNEMLVYEVVTGSRAYGLETEKSDTDIRGVFVLPKSMYYGLNYTEQVNNETNDIVYYELRRFMELLSKSNPTILEMLNTPAGCILKKHPIMEMIRPEIFLSKLCQQTFANYAYTQIKKAYGLEKKIVNPVAKERKSVFDFCWIYEGKVSVPLREFIEVRNLQPDKIGLAGIPHLKDCFNLYYSLVNAYSGVVKKDSSNDICLSDIPKEEKPLAMLYFNRSAYSEYCKKYKEYWDWVGKRNEDRYTSTMMHGKNYDSKNMMHVFRLLHMAKEIALEGKINVQRQDRDFLLAVKDGKYEYDELVQNAETLQGELALLYERSGLQARPDIQVIDKLLVKMREAYYAGKEQ